MNAKKPKPLRATLDVRVSCDDSARVHRFEIWDNGGHCYVRAAAKDGFVEVTRWPERLHLTGVIAFGAWAECITKEV